MQNDVQKRKKTISGIFEIIAYFQKLVGVAIRTASKPCGSRTIQNFTPTEPPKVRGGKYVTPMALAAVR